MEVVDLEELNTLSHDTILDILKSRYARDEIYTWASRTLVAINPYKQIKNCYYQETQQKLYDSSKPHIYSIAEEALSTLKSPHSDSVDASIIVSGESGSGKTESTKHLLRYLTVLTSTHQQASHIEKHILASNPVLEAFGNARTSYNDNSSRFGKYIILQYGAEQQLVGAHIQAYLLEKTRVVHQGLGHSNFHVFYQFLEGLTVTERGRYLPDCETYNYAQSPCNDTKSSCWADTLSALARSGFTQSNIDDICSTLGAILCLGNIELREDSLADRVEIAGTSEACMTKASSLLGIEVPTLERLLSYRCISASHARRRSVFHSPCTLAEAKARKGCLAKLLYDRLFCWLVEKINASIKCKDYKSFIGLLDIYGFESFQENSLEQLCINYANERLQQYFIQHYLRDLQAEYEEEGIVWQHVNITSDNISCIQLISGKQGIFALLNEECHLSRLHPKENLSELVFSSIGPHSHLKCSQKDLIRKRFGICHYADTVTYSSDSLVEKNKDLIPPDIIDTISGSRQSFISHLLDAVSTSDKPKQQKKTVLSRFKNSLDELLSALRTTECQYIRCIKPNREAKPGFLDIAYMDRQLKACGVMETVRIRSQVYAHRSRYEHFLSTYKTLRPHSILLSEDKENELPSSSRAVRQRRRTLLPSAELNRSVSEVMGGSVDAQSPQGRKSTCKKTCRMILLSVLGPDMVTGNVVFGTTKLFIKSLRVVDLLDSAVHKKLSAAAFTIQCIWRRHHRRKRQLLFSHSAAVIVRAMRRIMEGKRLQHSNHGLTRKHLSVRPNTPLTTEADQDVSAKPADPIFKKQQAARPCSSYKILFRKPGLVSIRRVCNVRLAERFHVRVSSLLKHSHIPSVHDSQSCSLVDCMSDRLDK
ncbi:unconventional myosin-XIX-like [Watersipora subatra]|uniref:unconventional myosin-XIX-like n=1 Tax=Watersipora subatra TaxID=2589382 RepID=UPI00355BABCB